MNSAHLRSFFSWYRPSTTKLPPSRLHTLYFIHSTYMIQKVQQYSYKLAHRIIQKDTKASARHSLSSITLIVRILFFILGHVCVYMCVAMHAQEKS